MSKNKIQLNLSTSQKYLMANSMQTVYLMLQIIQPKVDLGTSRLPVNVFDVDLSLQVTGDKSNLDTDVDLKVVKEVEIFKAAQSREEAMKEADRGNYERARQILIEQNKKLEEIYRATKDEELLEEMNQLNLEVDYMEENQYSAMNRKMMKDSSYQRRKRR